MTAARLITAITWFLMLL